MKKKIVNVLLSSAVAVAMMFSVTACGSSSDAQDTATDGVEAAVAAESTVADETVADDAAESTVADDTAESTVAETETATEADTDAAADGEMTLEAWVESDECAQFSEMMNEGLDGMTISFEVEGDVISMIFTLTEAIDVVDGAEEAMTEYFTDNAAIFEAIRDQLIEETGNPSTVLKLVYRNADGSDIFSQEF